MNEAPKLEDIMTAVGPAIELMTTNHPESKIIFTVCDVEMRRVAVGCREIAARLDGQNRDDLLEVAIYAEQIAQAMSLGSYPPDWLDGIKKLCN